MCWPTWDSTWGGATEIDLVEAVINTGKNQGNLIKDLGAGCQVYPGDVFLTNYTESIYDWHTYRLEWSGGYIRLLVDGNQKRAEPESQWRGPWDDKYSVILNLALGGNLGGSVAFDPGDTAGFAVDYVKHYAWESSPSFPKAGQDYELRSLVDNYVMTAKDYSGSTSRITMYTDKNWTSQKFHFVSAGGGYYYIRSSWSGKELQMKNESGNWQNAPFNVTMSDQAAVGSHKFKPIQDSAGKYYFQNEYGFYLTGKDAADNWNSHFRRLSAQGYSTVNSRRWIVKEVE
jgi:hypothetical protein